MRLLKAIMARVGLDFAEQAKQEVVREEEAAAHEVAKRFTRGSVGIQRGTFQTRKQLDRELEKL